MAQTRGCGCYDEEGSPGETESRIELRMVGVFGGRGWHVDGDASDAAAEE